MLPSSNSVPPITSSLLFLRIEWLSPVIIDSSKKPSPEMMIPSVGTLSPELTSRTSSLMMFLKEIISIEPSFLSLFASRF